jgi:hypothetical protein
VGVGFGDQVGEAGQEFAVRLIAIVPFVKIDFERAISGSLPLRMASIVQTMRARRRHGGDSATS